MMYKLYIFLLFMVLIMPSLEIISVDLVDVVYALLAGNENEIKIRFECMFMPDQGAFFVNYVIAAALSGAAMELIWFPLTLLYKISRARIAGEREYIKEQSYRFPFGAMYAWYLCVFTVIMAYSVTCPLIVPVGCVYLVLKYLVDKHNLYYARQTPHLDRLVHLEAVKLAMAAPIICLIWLYLFSLYHAGFMAMTSLATMVVLGITISICIAFSCNDWFRYTKKITADESIASSPQAIREAYAL
ncbi:CSC1-like protein 1 [Sardina pilchardus]|uniref:CSC1-like protein 1 n=1 Tax=Sardina pilchardus TaxID=27697 RepID=UPI002E10CF3B